MTEADLADPPRPAPALALDDLERVIASPDLLPPGIEVRAMPPREYSFRQPGMNDAVRVSTDPGYYEQNAESVELWSPGNRTFPAPEGAIDPPVCANLAELLVQPAS